MAKRQRHTPEQVISKLREAEVRLAKGTAIAQVCRDPAITENTSYRWRKEYGGLKTDQARRLKDLERENGRLKRLLAEAELDKAILKEAASGKYWARPRGARRSSTSDGCSARIASPNAGRAASWGSAARRSGARPSSPTMSPGWWGGWWPWPASTAATGIGG
jgi:putative transposase